MKSYIDGIAAKYPPGNSGTAEATTEDMCLVLNTPQADVLLVFNLVQISVDTSADTFSYYLDLRGLYMKENP